jgi:hypothetical protein
MSELDHSLLQWIVGDISALSPIATKTANMAERLPDYPFSLQLVANVLLARRKSARSFGAPCQIDPALLGRCQLVQQRLGLLQIGCVETFSEPAVDRREQFASLLRFPLIAP